jgi:uncharacterized protein (TIGR02147 family)
MRENAKKSQDWLNAEYARRQARNGNYSRRMFALQIGISSGRLSELMNGKRQLTTALAQKISSQLLLTPEERKELMQSLDNEANLVSSNYEPLSADTFYALSDWQHFAILNLMDTDDFEHDVHWIAKRLAISLDQARDAVNRLLRLNLIVERNGKWTKRATHLTTTHDIESIALRVSHRQSLEQVAEAMDKVPLDLRDITSITMAIDLKRIAQAKELIKKFRRDLSAFLESGDNKEEVYNLNIQLVPVTDIGTGKKPQTTGDL